MLRDLRRIAGRLQRGVSRVAAAFVLLGCAGVVLAGAPPATSTAAPVISLLTFGPGQIYWERFGHNGILVREPGQPARVYNYGIFDFHQKNFFLNFARGQMVYRVDAFPLDWTLDAYASEGRWVVEQDLALTDAQSRKLADFLAWNSRPEHANYHYDYFNSNCSTRVRDAIDQVLGGELQRLLTPRVAGVSYRGEVLKLMAPQPALMLGMDLVMGPAADQTLNEWQDAFIPMRLMKALRTVRVTDSHGVVRPLVSAEREVVPELSYRHAVQPRTSWLLLLFVAGVTAAALVLLLLGAGRRSSFRGLAAASITTAYAFLCGMAGVVLLAAWLFTDHWAMTANRNLLLLNPLWFALLPALWSGGRQARHARPRVLAGLSRGVLLILALLALPVALWDTQLNLPWVALLLPVHLAVLTTLRR